MSDSGVMALHLPVNGTGITLLRTSTELGALQAPWSGETSRRWSSTSTRPRTSTRKVASRPGAQPNQVLNALLRMLGAPISPRARVGDAVIFGPFTDDGDEQDVDPRVVALVQSLGFPISNQPQNNKEMA